MGSGRAVMRRAATDAWSSYELSHRLPERAGLETSECGNALTCTTIQFGNVQNWGHAIPPCCFPVPVFRSLVATSTILLMLLLTSKTATSATNSNHRTLVASLSSLAFGNIPLGNSLTQFETLTNTGDSTVTVSQATVTGPGFGVRGLSLPVSLGQGHSVTFRVLCTPLALGGMTGTIAVASTSPDFTIVLSGGGITAGTLSSSTTALNFGSVAVGASKSATATLTATGSNVTISSATSTSAEFSLSGLSLPQTLAAGQSIPVTLTFKPQSTGTASGNISLSGDATNSSVVETLTGSGMAATGSPAVSLQWSPSASSVVGYNVYRSTTSGGPYAKINPAVNASKNYLDTSVQDGRTYYYVSTAIETGGSESKYSNQIQAVIPAP
jgi:hypothetical protein